LKLRQKIEKVIANEEKNHQNKESNVKTPRIQHRLKNVEQVELTLLDDVCNTCIPDFIQRVEEVKKSLKYIDKTFQQISYFDEVFDVI
jgi:hypothetical protein